MEIDKFQDLKRSIADSIFIKVESWNLYLGDAGLAEALAIECIANLEKGATIASQKALAAVNVKFGGGGFQAPLIKLVSPGQIFDLEEILDPYCQ
tara:strand:+ start:146 stop:430 length:285 start_codon:yes stop_codon:yes gene_type:complete